MHVDLWFVLVENWYHSWAKPSVLYDLSKYYNKIVESGMSVYYFKYLDFIQNYSIQGKSWDQIIEWIKQNNTTGKFHHTIIIIELDEAIVEYKELKKKNKILMTPLNKEYIFIYLISIDIGIRKL